jgi:signal transduction histidine kinase
MIKRVLTNLIENGAKYGQAVRASIATHSSTIDILIDDDGPGIDPAELERVFQPFYRLEGSRARETGGIGLGLAIARSAVEAHGGSLTLRNRQDGGLTAQISLPVQNQP